MKERIKQLRKTLGLTQNEFGTKLGLAANTVTNYETGRRIPSNTVIFSICREFSVNEVWLRTGEGGKENMFLKLNIEDERFAHNISILSSTNDLTIRHIINTLAECSEAEISVLKKFLCKKD